MGHIRGYRYLAEKDKNYLIRMRGEGTSTQSTNVRYTGTALVSEICAVGSVMVTTVLLHSARILLFVHKCNTYSSTAPIPVPNPQSTDTHHTTSADVPH